MLFENPGMNASPLIDIVDAAALLALSVRQVRLLLRRDQLPYVSLPNGEIRFNTGDLLAWIDQRRKLPREVAQ